MKQKLRSEFSARQTMVARDLEAYYYSDVHFESVPRHSHDYTEVYLFAEGDVAMEIRGRLHPLRAGDVIVLPPGTEHRAVVGPETPYRRFVFWLSRDFCRRLGEESPDYLYLFRRVRESREYIFHPDPLAWHGLRTKLFSLLEELHTDRFGRDAQIGLCARELVLDLSRLVYQQQNPRARRETRSSYQAVIEYVSAHLEEDLSLDALSRALFLSKYYIAHLVQENTGLSLHQYVTKKRLAACCDAMRDGRSIAACCQGAGFENYSSFYRAFVKEYGLSPAAYRERTYTAGQARQE